MHAAHVRMHAHTLALMRVPQGPNQRPSPRCTPFPRPPLPPPPLPPAPCRLLLAWPRSCPPTAPWASRRCTLPTRCVRACVRARQRAGVCVGAGGCVDGPCGQAVPLAPARLSGRACSLLLAYRACAAGRPRCGRCWSSDPVPLEEGWGPEPPSGLLTSRRHCRPGSLTAGQYRKPPCAGGPAHCHGPGIRRAALDRSSPTPAPRPAIRPALPTTRTLRPPPPPRVRRPGHLAAAR